MQATKQPLKRALGGTLPTHMKELERSRGRLSGRATGGHQMISFNWNLPLVERSTSYDGLACMGVKTEEWKFPQC